MLNKDLMKQVRPTQTLRYSAACGIVTIGLCISTICSINSMNNTNAENLEREVGDLRVQMMHMTVQNNNLNAALQKSSDKLKIFVDTSEVVGTGTQYYNLPLSQDLQEYTYNRCMEYGIEDHYEMVLALMWQESNFQPSIISKTNDYGLMQINKANHKWISELLGTTNFLDPYQNINAGTYLISTLLLKYEDESKALMAYNMGEGCASKHWSRGTYSSKYSRSIIEKRDLIKTTMVIGH